MRLTDENHANYMRYQRMKDLADQFETLIVMARAEGFEIEAQSCCCGEGVVLYDAFPDRHDYVAGEQIDLL